MTALSKGRDASQRSVCVCLVLIATAAVGLRCWRLDDLSVTFDEFITGAAFLEAPTLRDHLALLWMHTPEYTPLYFALQYGWGQIAGTSILALRLLPVALGLLSIGFLFVIARRSFGARAALLATFMYALSPLNAWWAQGCRPYVLMNLLALVSMGAMLEAIRTNQRRWMLVNCVANLLMVWTFLTAVLLVIAQGLLIAYRLLRRRPRALIWGSANALVVATVLCWIVAMPHINAQGVCFPSLGQLASALVANDAMVFAQDIPSPSTLRRWEGPPFYLGAALALLLAYGIVRFAVSLLGRRLSSPAEREARSLLLLTILAPPLMAYAALSVFGRPFYTRYTLYTWPALYIAVSVAVCALGRPWSRRSVAAVLIALYLYQIPQVLPTMKRADWLGAAEHIAAHAGPEDLVLVGGEYLSGEVMGYNVRHKPVALDAPILVTQTLQAGVDLALYALAHGYGAHGRSVWYAVQRGEAAQAHAGELEDALDRLGLAHTSCAFVAGDTVLLYRITAPHEALLSARPEAAPCHVSGPQYSAVDLDALLDQMALPQEERANYRQKLRRVAVHTFFDPWDLIAWGLACVAADDAALAQAVARTAMSQAADFGAAHLVEAMALERTQQHAQAQRALDKAQALSPIIARTLGPATKALWQHARLDEAPSALRQLEQNGLIAYTPALFQLSRSKCGARTPALPLGIYAPRNDYYEKTLALDMTEAPTLPLASTAEAHLRELESISPYYSGCSAEAMHGHLPSAATMDMMR